MIIPGEPEIGADFAKVTSSVGNSSTGGTGGSVHVLHPLQFAASKAQPQTETDSPQQKAKRAKGISLEDQLHSARDMALSGHAVQQYQPRSLTNTALRTA
jgi:hypothetical protein